MSFPFHLCGLMVISPFAKFHPCKIHTQHIILGEPVTISFSSSETSFETLILRRQFLRSFSVYRRKTGLLMLPLFFNYVESQLSYLPSGLLSPLPDHQLLQVRDHGFCLCFILLNVLKAGWVHSDPRPRGLCDSSGKVTPYPEW